MRKTRKKELSTLFFKKYIDGVMGCRIYFRILLVTIRQSTIHLNYFMHHNHRAI